MIRGTKRPCLDCGALTDAGSRCPEHQAQLMQRIDAKRGPRPHYAGDYRKRAKEVRDSAEACSCCGRTPTPDDPMQADHVVEGDPASPLQPLLRSCNIRKSHRLRAKG